MPELIPVYDRLCSLAGDNDYFHRFLALYNPPRLAVGCSQLAWTGLGGPLLIRNYDFAPSRWEGLLLCSKWNKRRVLGMVDCLWGLLDGVNESGLSVSLSFGGDPKVGKGFAIPIIVRYVLETCATVYEAKEALRQVPSFMTYNLTLLDKSGAYSSVFLAPGKTPSFNTNRCITNHQAVVRSTKYATFTRTVERARFLNERLGRDSTNVDSILSDFLSPPLYASAWSRGFGTLYTASYDPRRLSVTLHWPGFKREYSMTKFKEETTELTFNTEASAHPHTMRSLVY